MRMQSVNDMECKDSQWGVVPKYRFGLREIESDGVTLACKRCGKEALRDEQGMVVLSPFCPFCGEKMHKEVSASAD